MAILTKLKKAARAAAFTVGLISCVHSKPTSVEPRALTRYEQNFKTEFDALTRATTRINELVEKEPKLKTAHYEIRLQFTSNPNAHYSIRSSGDRPHLEYIYPFAQLVGHYLEAKTNQSYERMKATPPSRWSPELGQLVSTELKSLHPNVQVEGTATGDSAPLIALGDLIIRGYRASRGLKVVLPQEDSKLANHITSAHERAYAATFEHIPKDQLLLAPESPGFAMKIVPTAKYMLCIMTHRGMTNGKTPKYQKVTKTDADAIEKIRKIITEELQ